MRLVDLYFYTSLNRVSPREGIDMKLEVWVDITKFLFKKELDTKQFLPPTIYEDLDTDADIIEQVNEYVQFVTYYAEQLGYLIPEQRMIWLEGTHKEDGKNVLKALFGARKGLFNYTFDLNVRY